MSTITFAVGGTISGNGSGLTNIPANTALTGVVPIINGGTGQTVKAAAFTALSPATSEGDMIYLTGGTNARLAIGSNGTLLTSNGTDPVYATLSTSTNLTGNGVSIVLDLANTAVTASTYYAPQVTYDAKGRATAASNILTTTGDLLAYGATNPVRLPVGTGGQALIASSGAATGLAWSTPMISANNAGFNVTVGASALTVTLTLSDGATAPTTTRPLYLTFRGATVSVASVNVVAVTSSLTITIPSGTTIGYRSNTNMPIYVYAMNNAGTVVLALSMTAFDLSPLYTSTAISGGASDFTLYSATAQNNLPIQYLGKFIVQEPTAGTWTNGPQIALTAMAHDYGGDVSVCQTHTTTFMNSSLSCTHGLSVPVGSGGGGSASYNNFLSSEWNDSTNAGYQVSIPGTYVCSIWLNFPSNTPTTGSAYLLIQKTDVTGSAVIQQEILNFSSTVTVTPMLTGMQMTRCRQGDVIVFAVSQSFITGAATATAIVSIGLVAP